MTTLESYLGSSKSETKTIDLKCVRAVLSLNPEWEYSEMNNLQEKKKNKTFLETLGKFNKHSLKYIVELPLPQNRGNTQGLKLKRELQTKTVSPELSLRLSYKFVIHVRAWVLMSETS